jgi:hypothetical protein
VLRATTGLGDLRAVLRSCSGFVEILCTSEEFEIGPRWLSLRGPTTHLHVQVPALTAALFMEAGEDAHPSRPSIWFLGRCGSPCLLLILDRAEGAERARQEAAFRALRECYGARVVFPRDPAERAGHTLH